MTDLHRVFWVETPPRLADLTAEALWGGIALTGGLVFSTILTPTVVPALMALLRDFARSPRKPSPSGKQERVEQAATFTP